MSSETPGSSSPKPPTTREMSLSSSTSSAVPPSTHTQLTFYHSSMSEDQSECRLPRSRASLPTPIPNLTKKSRGRRVPTKEIGTVDPEQKDSRLYVCTVEGCGKCFHRGEHLKRHIRSIHTHEKRMSHCSKYFSIDSPCPNQLLNAHFPCVKNSLTDTTIYCSISKYTDKPTASLTPHHLSPKGRSTTNTTPHPCPTVATARTLPRTKTTSPNPLSHHCHSQPARERFTMRTLFPRSHTMRIPHLLGLHIRVEML